MLILQGREVLSFRSKRVYDVSELDSTEEGEGRPTNVEVASGRVGSRPSREMRLGGGFPGHGGGWESMRESSVVGDVGIDRREGFARMCEVGRVGNGVDLSEGDGRLLRG